MVGSLATVAGDDVVLGVDIGTTSAKVTAFDVHGAAGGTAKRVYALHEPQPGHAVQDPLEVVQAAVDAIAGAASACSGRVAGIGLSSAMHSLVGLGADGLPLTDLLTWADTRAAAQADALRADHPGLHARTGTPLHPMAPLAKLVWLRENEPATFARVVRWAGVKELLVERLTGA
jgi:gluconokinase